MKRAKSRSTAALLLTMAVGGGFLVACGEQQDANEATAAKYGIKVGSEAEREAAEKGGATKVTPGSETPAAPEEFEVDGVSRDVDLRTLPQVPVTQRKLAKEMPSPLGIKSVTNGADQALQPATAPAGPMPAATTFAGMNFLNDGAGWPPDTDGAVGPNHYIQLVNTSIAIYTKTGGAPIVNTTLDAFFGATAPAPCNGNNQGDPVVLFDKYAGKWLVTDFAWTNFSGGPWYECIAISKGNDPITSGWNYYAIKASTTALNDYPKLGVGRLGVYMSANMFTGASSFAGSKVWALNRNSFNKAKLGVQSFTTSSAYGSLLPANADIALPPAGQPEVFASFDVGVVQLFKLLPVFGNLPASTWTPVPVSIPVAAFNTPVANVPQKGTGTDKLDTLGDRLMFQAQYSNVGGDSLWITHSVKKSPSSSVTGIRWYQISNPAGATPTVAQQGTYSPDGTWRWMPALAVDKLGNMAVGYSASSGTLFPSIRYAGRLVSDPVSTLPQGETTFFAGTGSQKGGFSRWGDYAQMTVDPVDSCTFWFTTEHYAATGSNWQTRIGSFKYPSCT